MFSFTIKKKYYSWIIKDIQAWSGEKWVGVIATLTAFLATLYCYLNDLLVIYGDAESHLNISKRVIDSITPGFAQLGGIWLPLPHVLMIPFVHFEFLWRSGLAGSIVSGIAYVISAIFLYKTTNYIINNKPASFIAAIVFIFNPNVMYFQATPMTELLLICFFILSTYYFIKFLYQDAPLISLVTSAIFGFCAVLTRYDGWFLVCLEALIIALYYIPWKKILSLKGIVAFFKSEEFEKLEGQVLVFAAPAFFGIFLWLLWGFLILGDPLYFTHSEFSAASQQQAWLARGNLPSYHNIWQSFLYYFVTAMSNAGVLMYFTGLLGFIYYLTNKEYKNRFYVALIFAAPFIFNVITLFLGQSVIFIPHLTPANWDHNLFNVRYGIMTVPLVAFSIGYLFSKSQYVGKMIIVGLFLFQFVLYGVGYSQVISYQDGKIGLSSQVKKVPDAQNFINSNYDDGFILMDDFGRSISIVRSSIPMHNTIYIGNKPYWEESLVEPQKYAKWIVMQKGDTIWKEIWERPEKQAILYSYFNKVYTSDEILIFKRISNE